MRRHIFPYYRRWVDAVEETRRLQGELCRSRDDLSLLRNRVDTLEHESRDLERRLREAKAVSGHDLPQDEVVAPDLESFLGQVDANYESLTNTFHDYVRMVDRLIGMRGVKILPLYEFAAARDQNAVLIGLRHDVDADPVNAVRLARHLARVGVCGSFYLLHTALYYGRFEGSLFIRSAEVGRWVRALIVAGCEIGVHNDALGVTTRDGLDGPLALTREIDYLRSLGAVIRGTAGHNSLPIYGAENAEVFVGRRLWTRSKALPDSVEEAIESIDENALGLTYEGTFASPRSECDVERAEAFARDLENASVRSESWMRTYLVDNPSLDWTVDVQVWVIGRDEWVVAGSASGNQIWHWMVSQDAILDAVENLPPGSRCLFVLHPEYFRG